MAHSPDDIDITRLLGRWYEGDREALDALLPVVYRELRQVARASLRHEKAGHSLQATALVHEAYLRLIEANRLGFENRMHFFAVAARLMRQILVDHARRKNANKRGAGVTLLDVLDVSPAVAPVSIDVIALDRALEELATVEERLARVVELRFFAGFTIDEAATSLGVSAATVERDWTMAKAWLYARLMMPGAAPPAG